MALALRRHFEWEQLACLRLPPGMPGQWHIYPIVLTSTTDTAQQSSCSGQWHSYPTVLNSTTDMAQQSTCRPTMSAVQTCWTWAVGILFLTSA